MLSGSRSVLLAECLQLLSSSSNSLLALETQRPFQGPPPTETQRSFQGNLFSLIKRPLNYFFQNLFSFIKRPLNYFFQNLFSFIKRPLIYFCLFPGPAQVRRTSPSTSGTTTGSTTLSWAERRRRRAPRTRRRSSGPDSWSPDPPALSRPSPTGQW